MKQLSKLVVEEFRDIRVPDKRLKKRCMKVASMISKNPSDSITQASGTMSSAKGAYRFFAHITREELLKPHIEKTIERIKKSEEVVIIEDTTYLNMSAHKATEGLGPIGSEQDGCQGLIVHTLLAVDIKRKETLGILGQEVWAREGYQPKGETDYQIRHRPRETECWQRGIQTINALNLGDHVITIGDRERDIYEVLLLSRENRKRFIIRANHDRLLETKKYLFKTLRQEDPIGTYEMSVPRKPGQRARKAIMSVRRTTVTIRPPHALKRRGKNVTVNAVEVYERHAPKGCTPLHWILLTSEPIETMNDCLNVIELYTSRWKIEEFHMGLKTGCHIEERQFKTRKRIEAFLGLSSVISATLVRMRDLSRDASSYEHGLTDIQLKLLRERVGKLGRKPSARTVLRAIAQLGGFLGRKSDGEPGWRTLYRGMYELLIMEQGFNLAKKILCLSSIKTELVGKD
jgi:hypothetical protein